MFDKVCFSGSKNYPIKITNSRLSGNIEAREGCKFIDVICLGDIKLGKFVSINGPGTMIVSKISGVEIGSFSSIASNVIIQEHYHRTDKISSYYMNKNIFRDGIEKDIISKGKIILEEDVWIGSNSVILSGVTIGRGSVIGAGSIVTKDVPRYTIAAGNPAISIRKRFRDFIIDQIEESRWWEKDITYLINYKELFNLDLSEKNCDVKIQLDM